MSVGGLLGAFNGYLVSGLGLQSLVVTLGTMALYRGIGYILLGTGSVNILPPAVVDFGINNLPGTQIPWTIVPFLVLAPIFAVVLQKTPTGKRIYALGGSPEVARYSGIDTRRMVLKLFVVSGVVARHRRHRLSPRASPMPAPTMRSAWSSTSSPSCCSAASASLAARAG